MSGNLKTRSVNHDGQVVWEKILEVTRTPLPPTEGMVAVTTTHGTSIMTEGHRVFVTPTEKKEAGTLQSGDMIVSVLPNENVYTPREVVRVFPCSAEPYVYDITADSWHNLVLTNSNITVSNSPDRHYHWRPPAHEETVSQFNKVFGHIWEDYELKEYLERGLDMVSASPPRTPFQNVDQLVQNYPEWRTLLLTGAMYFALQALRLNWIADEFSVAGETEVAVFYHVKGKTKYDIGLEGFNVPIERLFELRTDKPVKSRMEGRIKDALFAGKLCARSVWPDGTIDYCPISDVMQHDAPLKRLLKFTVPSFYRGSSSSKTRSVICTEDHSLYSYDTTSKTRNLVPAKAGDLRGHHCLAVVREDMSKIDKNGCGILSLSSAKMADISEEPPRQYMYDLCVPGPENFTLTNGILAHNSYSIGGISLDLEKSSKYESAQSSAKDQFDSMLEKAKATVKVILGLQQSRYGVGIRSALGPYVGAGILTPRKFL